MSTLNTKKPKKNVQVDFSQMDRALIPGRNECDCEATKHKLLNNCLNCGRIICEQEGLGPCFTCQTIIISKQEMEEMFQMNKKIAEFKLEQVKKEEIDKQNIPTKTINNKLNLKNIAASLAGFDKANEHKQKLLDFDRNSEKRTKVIDDNSDYFDLTKENWLSNEKRQELKDKIDDLHEKKFEVERKLELNFVNKTIVEVATPVIKDLNSEVNYLQEETNFKSDYEIVDFKTIMDKQIDVQPFYINKTTNKLKLNLNSKTKIFKQLTNTNLIRKRLQNSEILENLDEGFCLSINQPWASFAIEGIKLHEGRTWYTQYKGPLWIHASAKSPRQEEIQEAISKFKLLFGNDLKFPDKYLLGSLIGCVNLVKCLAHEDYIKEFKHQVYLEDSFVLIFSNPVKLNVEVPCSGKQKIFKLDKNIFKIASSQLSRNYGYKQ